MWSLGKALNIFLVFNITSVGIAAFLLLYLSQIPKTKNGCWYWGIAYSTLVVSYLVLLSASNDANVRGVEYFHVTLLMAFSCCLVIGTLQFFDVPMRITRFIILGAVAIVWFTIFFLGPEWFFVATIVPCLYLAFCTGTVAYLFYRKRRHNRDYVWLAMLLSLLTIHYLDYPFLRQNEAFAPYGFLIAGILNMLIVFFLLKFQFIHFRDRLVEAESLALKLAHHDSLTGVINRRRLFDLFDTLKLLVIRRKEKLTVIFIDLNNFKVINDKFGHEWGDHSLVKVARRIKSVVRETDVVARVGGDEFVILALSCQTPAHVTEFVNRIRERLQKPFIIQQQEHVIGAAIGYAVCPDDSVTLETLLSLADSKMFDDKQAIKALQ